MNIVPHKWVDLKDKEVQIYIYIYIYIQKFTSKRRRKEDYNAQIKEKKQVTQEAPLGPSPGADRGRFCPG